MATPNEILLQSALQNLMESTNFANFEARKTIVQTLVLQVKMAQGDVAPAALLAQRELVARRSTLMTQRNQLEANARKEADEIAKKKEAEAAWKRAVEAPMFTAGQKRFVQQAEFLMYLKALDQLILKFDRSNTFNLVYAVDETTQQLNYLRRVALEARETLGATAALVPTVPQALYQTLVRGTFIRYIRWQAALDLDR